MLAGCGLPRGGPTKREILASSTAPDGTALVVPVDAAVNRLITEETPLGFPRAFIEAGILGADTIQPGDRLGLTIYENVEDGLLVGEGMPSAQIDEVQVSGDGFIFVPFAGRLRAAGNTPEALRRVITNRLSGQTPDPQVEVRRLAGDGASVSVVGGVGGQGVYPIEQPTRRLTGMLAEAGGLSIPDEVAQITVVRGGQRGQVWFGDLYDNPNYDIALRAGDRILVEQDERSFVALGATGAQRLVEFDRRKLSAIDAIAQVGGLSSALADPTGVFVFRDESEAVARRMLGRADVIGPQRLIYLLDLTKPNGMFVARDFVIQDGDTIYVTEAPYVQWRKTLSALTGTVGSADNITSLAGN